MSTRSPFERFGDRALRARVEDASPARLRARLAAVPGVLDAVVTEAHALVTFGEVPPSAEALARALDPRWRGEEDAAVSSTLHVIAARYDGPDLAEVSARLGLAPEEVVRRHTAVVYDVRFVGFAPGFAYLGPLDASLTVPRRAEPRPRVPAGAVAIAGPYTAVYPFATPGGWSLLGAAVGFTAFTPETGARLALGDRVRFEAVP